ncbi:MAG: hypothetical protein ACRC2T_18305 [Thermoguttaceae bacterium]
MSETLSDLEKLQQPNKAKTIKSAFWIILLLFGLFEIITQGGIAFDNSYTVDSSKCQFLTYDATSEVDIPVSINVGYRTFRYYIPLLFYHCGNTFPVNIQISFLDKSHNISEIHIKKYRIVFSNGDTDSKEINWSHNFNACEPHEKANDKWYGVFTEYPEKDKAYLLLPNAINNTSSFSMIMDGYVLLTGDKKEEFQIEINANTDNKFVIGTYGDVLKAI